MYLAIGLTLIVALGVGLLYLVSCWAYGTTDVDPNDPRLVP